MFYFCKLHCGNTAEEGREEMYLVAKQELFWSQQWMSVTGVDSCCRWFRACGFEAFLVVWRKNFSRCWYFSHFCACQAIAAKAPDSAVLLKEQKPQFLASGCPVNVSLFEAQVPKNLVSISCVSSSANCTWGENYLRKCFFQKTYSNSSRVNFPPKLKTWECWW